MRASSGVRYSLRTGRACGVVLIPSGGVAQDEIVQPGCFKQLPHGQQDLVLQADGFPGHTGHDPADVDGAYFLQLHRAQFRHDVLIVGAAVHTNGAGPEVCFVALQPHFRPFSHQRVVIDLQSGLILDAQRILCGVQFGQCLAVYNLLPPV